jgi:hypothetical protein
MFEFGIWILSIELTARHLIIFSNFLSIFNRAGLRFIMALVIKHGINVYWTLNNVLDGEK